MSQFLHKKLRYVTLGEQYDWETRSYTAPATPSPNGKDVGESTSEEAELERNGSQRNARTGNTPFPADIADLVTSLFNDAFTPESGVVLLYSSRDYMPVHRDVSEECARGLASISLGCDGLFMISRDKVDAHEVGGAGISPRVNRGEEGSASTSNAEDAENGIGEPGDGESNDRETPEDLVPQTMVILRVRSGDVVQMAGETRWAWHAMPKILGGTAPEWAETWPVVKGREKEDRGRGYEVWKGYMKGKRLNISCRQVWG